MDSLNTILNSGTYGENVSRHNDNNSKIKQAITTLENVAIANKGYFDTLASLQAAFPSPKAGNIAYVANVASSTGYYIYNVVSGVWTATTTEAPAVDVAISNYAQHGYSSSPKTLKQVDDEVVQLAGEVIMGLYLNVANSLTKLSKSINADATITEAQSQRVVLVPVSVGDKFLIKTVLKAASSEYPILGYALYSSTEIQNATTLVSSSDIYTNTTETTLEYNIEITDSNIALLAVQCLAMKIESLRIYKHGISAKSKIDEVEDLIGSVSENINIDLSNSNYTIGYGLQPTGIVTDVGLNSRAATRGFIDCSSLDKITITAFENVLYNLGFYTDENDASFDSAKSYSYITAFPNSGVKTFDVSDTPFIRISFKYADGVTPLQNSISDLIEINGQLLMSIDDYMQLKFTNTDLVTYKTSAPIEIPPVKAYNSWSKMYNDKENNRMLIVYGSGPDHPYVDKDVRLAIYSDGVIIDDYVVIAGSAIISMKPIGITKLGDKYVIYATYGENIVDEVKKIVRYESSDLKVWEEIIITFPILFTGSQINVDNVSIVDGVFFISQGNYGSPKESYVMKSIDGGMTFTSIKLNIQPDTTPCEMIFFRIKKRIIGLARRNLAIQTFQEPLQWTYSEDGGDTWSAMADVTGITNANSSNLGAIFVGNDKLLLLYATRFNSATAGVYYSLSHIDDVYNGIFSEGVKLFSGTANADFGYPAISRYKNKIYTSYYSGTSAAATIKIRELICDASLNFKIEDSVNF